jgi:putative flavoprotein involved in K+ transport
MKIRKRSGGYYLNIGCSELIIKGEIGLLQYDLIEKLVAEGALLKDGSIKAVDLVVLGTGFQPLESLVRELLGDKIADKIGRVWGLGPDGEMNNMWKRTAQEGLWLVGSGLAASRQYSRVVALQVKAVEEGLISKKR